MIHEIFVAQNQVLVNLSDRIYIEEAAELRESLLSYIESGHNNFVINFSQVESIDCSGLGALVAIHKKALHHGGGITIKGLHGASKDLFELTRLNKVFDIHQTDKCTLGLESTRGK